MPLRRTVLSALVLAALCLAAPQAEAFSFFNKIDAETEETIEHLIRYVGDSELIFSRNWQEYSAAEAEEHIREKYDFVLKRGMIKNVKDFIFWCATRSYLTGQMYEVKLKSGEVVNVRDWLNQELERYLKARAAAKENLALSAPSGAI